MTITKQTAASQIAAYLHHEITQAQLVEWAEQAMMEEDFAEPDMDALRTVISRVGLANVRAFGHCEELLEQLGYAAQVEVVAA